jgi:NAD(P)-dependent dehydrogenase (short-subunit alcohol dehydrogenase family)
MTADLAGRAAIVTGASSGIGRAIAARLVQEGARVLAADIRIDDAPPDAEPFQVDVRDPAQVRRMVEVAHERFGRLDVLCNNAGRLSTADLLTCTLDEWDDVFATNVRAMFLAMQAAVPLLLEDGGGAIVNTSSIAAVRALRDRVAYAASKGAVISLTRQVAVQYSGVGVRCNCVVPGPTDTTAMRAMLAGTGADDLDVAVAAAGARLPVGRVATPMEIASVVVFLASDSSSFITGTAIVVDGGALAG